jgi:uncharacterized protein
VGKGNRSVHIPIRTCVACRSKRSKAELLRLVLDEEGCTVRDEMGRKPGRGAYVCRAGSCLEDLEKSRLERALRIKRAR